jgi:hypothetical protein
LGATLKIELRRRTYNSFSEQQLGFARFGDFLKAAETSGYVQLRSTPGGDLEVFPAGVEIPQFRPVAAFETSSINSFQPNSQVSQSGGFGGSLLHVRQDLWNAFNSFHANWAYDPKGDLAFKLQETPNAKGMSQPLGPGLLQIPSGRAQVIEWMRSFASMQDPETKVRLLAVLSEDESAPYNFTSALRTDRNLLRAWRRFHIKQVVSAIEAWAASNNLRPQGVATSFGEVKRGYWPVQAALAQAAQATAATPQVEIPLPAVASTGTREASPILTSRLAALIDELIDELARVRGLLHIVGPKS